LESSSSMAFLNSSKGWAPTTSFPLIQSTQR
jgi:hypothetical protein